MQYLFQAMFNNSKLGNILLKYEIGSRKFVEVNEVENNVCLDLINDNMMLPLHLRGCRLASTHFALLMMNASIIEEHIKELRNGDDDVLYLYHFGNGLTCCISSFLQSVTFKVFDMLDNVATRPNWHGLVLRIAEWDNLKSKFDNIKAVSPILNSAVPSYINYVHNECECTLWCPYSKIGLVTRYSDNVRKMNMDFNSWHIAE